MLKNTRATYGSIAKAFHWTMALLFVGMFTIAYIMINIQKSDFRFTLYDLHKATGLLLFLLVILRLGWRATNVDPLMPSSTPRWQKMMAKMNIAFLYVLMFAMPMSGFLTSTLGGHEVKFYGIFSIPSLLKNAEGSELFSTAHDWLSWVLVALFTMHVLAALYHHYYLKDKVLKQML